MRIRPATEADYDAFTILFRELAVPDPVPSHTRWAAELAPQAWIAEAEEPVGYCIVNRLDHSGYVRHLVSAAGARRTGVGLALMQHVGAWLSAGGATEWRLNVKPENAPARRLYESLGMRLAWPATTLWVPRDVWAALPSDGSVASPVVDFAEAETRFALPAGQLRHAANDRVLLGARRDHLAGLAVFSPSFPGAFPFRAEDVAAARALADGIHHTFDGPGFHVTLEDDAGLEAALLAAGAELRLRTLHYVGALPPRR